jgi:hypothetical protein
MPRHYDDDEDYADDFEEFEDEYDEGDEWEENPDDDDGGDFDDGGEQFEYEEGYEGAYVPDEAGDDFEPEWWQKGMPDDWYDYYDDSYEVEEWEFAIDY